MTMIEKIARALATKHGYSWDSRAPEIADRIGDLNCEDYKDFARIALEVMRGPTEEMKTAFYQTYHQSIKIDPFGEAWTAMIDAALVEK